MSVNKVNSDGSLTRIAGGLLYADAPIGTIVPFGGSVIPSGYLSCHGQAVSRTDYAELFTVIGTTFGTGDGSTTFNVPDLCETVPVGIGMRTIGVVDHDSYTLGQFKDDQLQSHGHTIIFQDNANINGGGSARALRNETPYNSSSNTLVTDVQNARTGTTTHGKQLGVNYIIKAKQVAVPADFKDAIDDAVEEVYGDVIPNYASASNKLVAHQTPYEVFILNNNSGTQKWYKLGQYEEGNYPARLDFISARVDGQMFESSIRISGNGSNSNYVSWIGESGCEISTTQPKVDESRNVYIKMNSYSAVELRIYGTFTLSITEVDGEPSGVNIELQRLVAESSLIVTANGNNSTAEGVNVSSTWEITSNGSLCICYGTNTEAFNPTETSMTSMQLPSGYVFDNIISANVFMDGRTSWITGASHKSGNGAGTYVTSSGLVNAGSFRQIVLAHKA